MTPDLWYETATQEDIVKFLKLQENLFESSGLEVKS